MPKKKEIKKAKKIVEKVVEKKTKKKAAKQREKQHQKSKAPWLAPYRFKKGVSGNPSGKKKGTKSMKTFAREYFNSMPEEDRVEFLNSLNPETVWKMAEGNPQNDITSGGEPITVNENKKEKADDLINQYLHGRD